MSDKKHCYRFLASRGVEPGAGYPDWSVAGDECLHLRKVLRLGIGAEVEVADGAGRYARGEVTAFVGQTAVVRPLAEYFVAANPAPLSLVLGALKAGFVEDLLPSLVELGVDSLHVFLAEQTARDRVQGRSRERWQKIVAAAVKQSKRPYLPVVTASASLSEALAQARQVSGLEANCFYLSHEASRSLANEPLTPSRPLIAVVGGEKGLSHAEEALLAAAGFTALKLGNHVLRAYTAAIATTALLTLLRER